MSEGRKESGAGEFNGHWCIDETRASAARRGHPRGVINAALSFQLFARERKRTKERFTRLRITLATMVSRLVVVCKRKCGCDTRGVVFRYSRHRAESSRPLSCPSVLPTLLCRTWSRLHDCEYRVTIRPYANIQGSNFLYLINFCYEQNKKNRWNVLKRTILHLFIHSYA